MHYIDIKSVMEVMKGSELSRTDQSNAYLSIDNQPFHVKITYQKTGFGEKPFLCCPKCGSRRVKLYLYSERLLCRECLPYSLYSGLTHTTKGGHKYIRYRMQRLAARNGIILKGPFHYDEYPKPKGKNDDAWEMILKKLQGLENMRIQALSFNKRYSDKTIRSVLLEKNILLYVLDLYDIDRYFYNWDKGYIDFPGNPNDIEVSGIFSNVNAYQSVVLESLY
ncbi:hypothetical protein [Lacrimispora indolis]|uniref:hypothetical protein n=1 Tax=Lacrimispora indolis TaxID=69825 RepID=UPI00045EB113|nr:hypothetical protein [Lacrimispora indolis]